MQFMPLLHFIACNPIAALQETLIKRCHWTMLDLTPSCVYVQVALSSTGPSQAVVLRRQAMRTS